MSVFEAIQSNNAEQFKSQLDNCASKADLQQISLSYKESYDTLLLLQTAYPIGNVYNHTVKADGMIYTYNNGWVSTGVQANGTGTPDGTISEKKTSFFSRTSNNVLKIPDIADTTINGIIYSVVDGVITINGTTTASTSILQSINFDDLLAAAYVFSFGTISGTKGYGKLQFTIGGSLIDIINTSQSNNPVTLTAIPTACRLYIGSGIVFANWKFNLWANAGTVSLAYKNYNTFAMDASKLIPESVTNEKLAPKSVDYKNTTFIELTPSNNVLSLTETMSTTINGVTYSIKDDVITLNGTATGNIGTPNIASNLAFDGVYQISMEDVVGSYTGLCNLQHNPTGTTVIGLGTKNLGFIFTTLMTGLRLFISTGSVFSNYKVKLWINKGLSPKPYKPLVVYTHVDRIGNPNNIETKIVTQCEYNTLPFDKINDDVLYQVFGTGKQGIKTCHNGKVGLNVSSDRGYLARFSVITDMHSLANSDYTPLFNYFNTLDLDFTITLGDNEDSGYYNTYSTMIAQKASMDKDVKVLNSNFYPFAGNHDRDEKGFCKNGVIDFNGVRFIFFWADYVELDVPSDYHGSSLVWSTGVVSPETLAWIESKLAEPGFTHKVLMCHYSMAIDPTYNNFIWWIRDAFTQNSISYDGHRDDLLALAQTYGVKLYLNGHEHNVNYPTGLAGVMTDVNCGHGAAKFAVVTITNTQALFDIYSSTALTKERSFSIPLV